MTSGPAAGRALTLDREIVVGRAGADLTIDDSELSRRHLALRPAEGGIEIEDLGSRNGTFVDDRRIEGAVTVSGIATLRAGLTTLELDAGQPPIADPQATIPRQAQAPPEADVTRARPKPRAPDPGATAPRAPDPGATAPRAAPPAADPELTAPRPSPPRPPSEPAAPPPARREPSAPARAGGPPPLGAIVPAVLAVAAVVVLVLIATGGSSEEHEVETTVRNTFLELDGGTETVTGVISGSPFGGGSTLFRNQYAGLDEALPGPAPVASSFTLFFDDGSVTGTAELTIEQSGEGEASINGPVEFTGGSREFDGASGSGTFEGRIDLDENPPRTNATLTGEIEY